jgi:predicted transcriptional regulator
MEEMTPTTTTLRTWQEVRKERGISLRILGELVGRTDKTMQAYSMGIRATPEEVLWRLARVLGEPVR